MTKLNSMENIVLQVLEESTAARKDDYVLIYLVCEKTNPAINQMDFGTALYHHKDAGMPNWETITRARRKIQEKRPDLVDRKTANMRQGETEAYIEYSKT